MYSISQLVKYFSVLRSWKWSDYSAWALSKSCRWRAENIFANFRVSLKMTLTAVWMSDVVDLEFLPLTKQHFMVGIFPFVLLCCVTCWAWADVSNSGKLLSQWCRTGLQQLKQLHSSWQVLFLVLRHCSLNGISVCYDVAINTVSFLKKTQKFNTECTCLMLSVLSPLIISRYDLKGLSHFI